jgi:hypothetical protein
MSRWPLAVLISIHFLFADGFFAGSGPNSLSVILGSHGFQRQKCRYDTRGLIRMKSQRPDGASEEEIRQAYETYNELMRTNNYGKGYWMDEPFQFFTNIKEAFSRNFGDGRRVNALEMLNKKQNVVDLSDSPFKPLVSVEQLEKMELEAQSAPKAAKAIPLDTPASVTPTKKSSKTLKKSSKSAATVSTQQSSAVAASVRHHFGSSIPHYMTCLT